MLAAPVAAETLMLEQPSISGDRIAFVYAGDIWTARRDGSEPRRLTSNQATENDPSLSPDGRWVAFSAGYNGNADVYIVPVEGGQPKRLTWHPYEDQVRGWTPDGKSVLFATNREVMTRGGQQIFSVSIDGGLEKSLPMPAAVDLSFSSDGRRVAYMPFTPAQWGTSGWDRYRGGRTPPIWLFDLSGHGVEKIPHDRVNDTDPMWVGATVYFLSDRAGRVNLFAYDTSSRAVTQLTHDDTWDIESAAATGDAIIFDRGGRLNLFDLREKRERPLNITLTPDLPQLSPQWKDASRSITSGVLSPQGARAAFSARGDIFTVPLKHGDTRNLTRSVGANDRDPLWSPDGQKVAWVSDDKDRFELIVAAQDGSGERKRINLGDGIYYFLTAWSPDGSSILYEDAHLNLYLVDLEGGASRRIDSTTRRLFGRGFESVFSPDGKWVAYVRALPNYLRALYLHDVKNKVSHQVTDGMAEVSAPAFSRDGKYLYVAASTNFGNSTVGLDMSTQDRPVRSGLYAFVLAADGNTPLPPESDEEEAKKDDEKDGAKDAAGSKDGAKDKSSKGDDAKGSSKKDDGKDAKKTEPTKIDLEGLAGRMVALPIAEKNYGNLRVAADGSLFYLDQTQAGASREAPGSEGDAVHILKKFDFKERKEETWLEEVASFEVGSGGKKLLIRGPKQGWSVVETEKKPTGRGDAVSTANMKTKADPKAEWAHIFHDAWRMEKEYFYAQNMHGLDWRAVEKKYEPLVQHLGRREDLNALIIDMIAELQVGHNRISGGDLYRPDTAPIGLLGADYEIAGGRYRIRRLLKGAPWNPFDSAPLAVPGLRLKEGDYILAVDGRELSGDDNIFSFFEGTVGKQVRLTVGSGTDLKAGRDITVVPIASDQSLRLWTWIEDNRRKVSEATDGRVGYIYLPNTGDAGFTYFNRYFFSQVDKEALIVDERFNGGGQAANYITETLSRPWLSGWMDRDGLFFSTPAGVVTGPKVMLINESSGSGGDYLPWSFRHVGLGPLIGTRTWGGLIGISANPPLIDGGNLTVPYFRYFDPSGRWSIENEGVPPDIEVEQSPKDVIAGHDPQLERGIAEVLERLKSYRPVIPKTPPPVPTQVGR